MGSLVPGWDSGALGPPRELEDIDESEQMQEPRGYFEKYERQKSAKRTSDSSSTSCTSSQVVEGAGALHRTSAPISMGDRAVRRTTSLERTSAQLAGSLDRASSLQGRKYVGTDWSHELSSLRGSSLVAKSVESQKEEKSDAWWHHLDAGALNEAVPQEEDRAAWTTGSFVPQFNVAGQAERYSHIQEEEH